MKKRWIRIFIMLSAWLLVACDQQAPTKDQQESTETPTEQTEQTESSTEQADKEEASDQEKPVEETKEEKNEEKIDDEAIMDRITKHLKQTTDANMEHLTFLISEQEDYRIYEARTQNPEDPNVTNLLGMYRYYPDKDLLEVYSQKNDDYEPIK